jgi:hypothetical protein
MNRDVISGETLANNTVASMGPLLFRAEDENRFNGVGLF